MRNKKKLRIISGIIFILAVIFYLIYFVGVWNNANLLSELLFGIIFLLKFFEMKKSNKKEAYSFLLLAIVFCALFIIIILKIML